MYLFTDKQRLVISGTWKAKLFVVKVSGPWWKDTMKTDEVILHFFWLPMILPKWLRSLKFHTKLTMCCLGKLLIWIVLLKLIHIQFQQLISLNLIVIIWQVFPNNSRGLTNKAHPDDLNRRFSTCSGDDRFHLLCTPKNEGFQWCYWPIVRKRWTTRVGKHIKQ